MIPYRYFFVVISLLLPLFLLALSSPILAQCSGTQATVVISVIEDSYADAETSWQLRDQNNTLLGSGTPEGTTICVPASACLTFTINDSYGDGLASGSYTVTYNGTVVGSGSDFGSSATHLLGNCAMGSNCSLAIPVTAGTYTAANPDTWYSYTPDSAGVYLIDACSNTCNTAIWIYDDCPTLVSENLEGAMNFSDSGCGNQALLSNILTAGNTYMIRIGDELTHCAGDSIAWSLSYNGSITGCMNPSACNYNPLATVNDPSACMFAGNPNCPDGPDLTVVQSVLQNTLQLSQINNSGTSGSCWVNEGCMNGYGMRTVIRFTTRIENIGNQDYYIGMPSSAPQQFEYDACHQHYHYEGYAEYLLYDANGVAIPIGFKNGFCVMDLECPNGGYQYHCGNMGISAGCADYYDSYLDCQWIDITNVPTGIYTFVVRVNWDNSPDALGHFETNMVNNWAQVCLSITQNAVGGPTFSVVNSCSPFVDCTGQIYGNAALDCNGVCMGIAKAGDLNNDTTYNNADRLLYMSAVVQHNVAATNCKDLNNDDSLTVTDPILLNACMHQLDGTHPPDGTDHCDLPTANVWNPTDTAWFRLVNYDPIVQYIDVYLKSPDAHLLGYQFRVSGIDIINIESLLSPSEFAVHSSFNANTGDIALFSTHEVQMPRYLTYQPLLRIYYAVPIAEGATVCLSQFTAVNSNYEEIVGLQEGCFVPYLAARANVWLQGAYNATAGNMNNTLNVKDLLPLSQPFNQMPWNYAGIESVNNMPENVVDWVLVELRDATTATIVERRAALLLQNGTLQDVNGNVGANFYVAERDTPYYILMRTRNHLAVLANTAITLPTATSYDFSLPSYVVGGAAMLRPLFANASGVHYGLIAGDINANGVITVADLNQYMTQMSHMNIYEQSDCDLDGNVLISDFNYLNANISAIGAMQVRY